VNAPFPVPLVADCAAIKLLVEMFQPQVDGAMEKDNV
jgi:hypothetical protein